MVKNPKAKKGKDESSDNIFSNEDNSSDFLKHETKITNKKIVADNLFPVVGIGASAGGLEAISQLLKNIPPNSGMAFVIIQHLAPEQDSMLAEILSRTTDMQVSLVKNGMQIVPNHVYVIPPKTSMTLLNKQLILQKGSSRVHREVDQFFTSLGHEHKNLAIGIILSGTGNDGSEGLKTIYSEGGITFAQEEETAKYAGMPHNAIATESVHFVMSPKKIAQELTRIAQHPYLKRDKLKVVKPKIEELTDFQKILGLIKIKSNVNFSAYKESTLNRRILRRMVIHQIEKIGEYLKFLREHEVEQRALFNDLLIGVTRFFRETETFKQIEEHIWPTVLKNKSRNGSVRIWVPGCATGEEVYSLAMSLKLYMEKVENQVPILIFGTDVNEKNIKKARIGEYDSTITKTIPKKILNRFFDKIGNNYQINKSIRDVCVFAKQDLIRDPPFSNLDLISCRNLLIYIKFNVQKKIIPLFHYALKKNAFLVLGKSESVGEFKDLFEQIKKTPIYLKKLSSLKLPLDMPTAKTFISVNSPKKKSTEKPIDKLQKKTNQVLVTKFSPPGVIVNSNFDVLLFQGDTSKFLVHNTGEANLNLVDMARDELKLELQTAVYLSKKQKISVKRGTTKFKHDGIISRVNIEVIPLKLSQSKDYFYIVLFEDLAKLSKKESEAFDKSSMDRENDSLVANLTKELSSTKQSLQTIIEEQEATNEELRSAMEEVQSSNEELQITNEELETAKEELQSTNEELTTVNEELKVKNDELIRSEDDMRNVFKSINIAVVVLDKDFKIRFFTPAANENFNFMDTDIGRSIRDISLSRIVPNFNDMIIKALEDLKLQQTQIQDDNGTWHELTCRPYLTSEMKIDGVVLSIINIDAIKKQELEIKKTNSFNQTILETIKEPLIVLDSKGQIVSANIAFYQKFNVIVESDEAQNLWTVNDNMFDIPKIKKTAQKIFHDGLPVNDLQVNHNFSGLDKKTLNVTMRRLSSDSIEKSLVLITIDDVTEITRLYNELKRHNQNLEELVKKKTNQLRNKSRLAAIGQTASMVGHDIRNPLQSIEGELYIAKQEIEEMPSTPKKNSMLESLNTIQDRIHYINKIVTDLQDFTRPIDPKKETIDFKNIIDDVLDNLIIPKNIKLVNDVEENLPELKSDPTCIIRILDNLIRNAIQAMPNGGKLSISIKKGNEKIIFSVGDTGNGIPKDIREKIFEPLFTTKAKGQGFGLAVCLRLVETLGGSINFESKKNRGTKFIFKLPVI